MTSIKKFADSVSVAEELKVSEIVFAKHNRNGTLDEIRKTVSKIFPEPVAHYLRMNVEQYRELVVVAQAEFVRETYTRKIVSQIQSSIVDFLREERFLIQTNIYLRAARPLNSGTEAIGWHRETFYGGNMERSVNVWTPVLGVNESNTLRFIPQSQLLLDAEILTDQYQDEVTKRFSVGHEIGFQYAPKKIVGGVNLEDERTMVVPAYHSSIFPGNLIHGAGKNESNDIRFSLDFRILPLSAYDSNKTKHYHFASKKPYFEEY